MSAPTTRRRAATRGRRRHRQKPPTITVEISPCAQLSPQALAAFTRLAARVWETMERHRQCQEEEDTHADAR